MRELKAKVKELDEYLGGDEVDFGEAASYADAVGQDGRCYGSQVREAGRDIGRTRERRGRQGRGRRGREGSG